MKMHFDGRAILRSIASFGLLLLITWGCATGSRESAERVPSKKSADEIIEMVDSKSAEWSAWSADVFIQINLPGQKGRTEGRTVYRDGLYWSDIMTRGGGSKHRQLTIKDPEKFHWTENHVEGEVIVTKLHEDELKAMAIMGGAGGMRAGLASIGAGRLVGAVVETPDVQLAKAFMPYDYHTVEEGEFEGEPVYILSGELKAEMLDMARGYGREALKSMKSVRSIELIVGASDGFPRRMQYSNGRKTSLIMEYRGVKIGDEADDVSFQYEPPAGSEVLDMRGLQARYFDMMEKELGLSDE